MGKSKSNRVRPWSERNYSATIGRAEDCAHVCAGRQFRKSDYFLSEEDDAATGAGAGAAGGGVDEEVLSDAGLEVVSAEDLLSPLDFGFALPYPSENQPPPLKAKAGAERTRSRWPVQ